MVTQKQRGTWRAVCIHPYNQRTGFWFSLLTFHTACFYAPRRVMANHACPAEALRMECHFERSEKSATYYGAEARPQRRRRGQRLLFRNPCFLLLSFFLLHR